jgi:hypothetical protein
MKSLIGFFILFIMVGSPVITYSQTPYAQWAKLRKDIPDGAANSYETMKQNTPERDWIDLPPYPDAKIIETSQSTQSIDDSKNPELPTVTLISSDTVDKITGMYKDLIQDYPRWRWDENLGIFYKGNLQDALNRRAPFIQVTPIKSDQPDLVYISSDELAIANSKIVVCYDPGSIR